MAKEPPSGWAVAKYDMDTAGFCYEDYDLEPGKMILFNKKLSTYLLECGGKYYLWNDISDGVDQIQKPEKLEDIYEKLSDLNSLETIVLNDV